MFEVVTTDQAPRTRRRGRSEGREGVVSLSPTDCMRRDFWQSFWLFYDFIVVTGNVTIVICYNQINITWPLCTVGLALFILARARNAAVELQVKQDGWAPHFNYWNITDV